MRIIGGSLKGQKLYAPKCLKVRPTSDRVKEAIFNVLSDVSGLHILDLYAGTGNLSFEALSRGASDSILIDKSKEAMQIIQKNAANLHLENKITILSGPVGRFIMRTGRKDFDMIFADPPYNMDERDLTKLLQDIRNLSLLGKEGIMVLELSSKRTIELDIFQKIKVKKYGNTKVYFLKK